MPIRISDPADPRPGEITPRESWERLRERRALLGAAVGAALTPLVASAATPAAAATQAASGPADAKLDAKPSVLSTMERPTPREDVTGYNNFYEFGTDKSDPERYAKSLRVRPWTVAIEGEVAKPGRFDVDDLRRLAPLEERIYRLRCVEGWSMVIAWLGYSLSELMKRV